MGRNDSSCGNPCQNEKIDLGALGKDGDLASKALWFIPKHPHPTAEFIPLVHTAGRDIVERIRKVNVTTAEADPSYLAAADVSVRFSGWIDAARTLHNCCGGDFTPELKTILPNSYFPAKLWKRSARTHSSTG